MFYLNFSCVFSMRIHKVVCIRHLRMPARRDVFPKLLKGGKVVSLDNTHGDRIAPVEEYEELNRNLRKMFTDSGEIQNEEEIDFDDQNLDHIYENTQGISNFIENKSVDSQLKVKRHIIKKKYFQEPKETNLLTYAAKKQIRYLHRLDPVEWNPKKLSKCFPISVPGVKKLLKNNSQLTEEKIPSHDADVAKRWEVLESDENSSDISPMTLALWKEGKLLKDYYQGNKNLPVPEAEEKALVITRPKKRGEYSAIIKKYIDIKNQQQEMLVSKDSPSEETERAKNVLKSLMPDFKNHFPKKSDLEDVHSASYLAAEMPDLDPALPSRQYEENLMMEFADKRNKTPAEEEYYQWLQKKMVKGDDDVHDTAAQTLQRYDSGINAPAVKNVAAKNTLEMVTEKSGRNEVGYVYDPDSGYKCIIKTDHIQRHITIPSHLYKENALYRVGKCFYSHTGEFLYKVPFALK